MICTDAITDIYHLRQQRSYRHHQRAERLNCAARDPQTATIIRKIKETSPTGSADDQAAQRFAETLQYGGLKKK